MNGFEAFADRYTPRTVKQKNERASARAARAIERKEEKAKLGSSYERSLRRWEEEVLQGPDGEKLHALLAWIDTLGPDDAETLVSTVTRQGWLLQASEDLRFLALRRIGNRITAIRLAMKMTPFDDSLPGQPDNAFVEIRKALQA